MYTASDLKKGLRLKIDNEPYIITEFNFVKPGKGQALYRSKLKNMITGSQFERTFRSVDNFEPADLREKKMQYLYKEGDKYCFMDNESYEQVFLTEVQVGDSVNFLIDNIVTEAEPWAKGDTVSGATKPVKVQTGYTIFVPTFVTEGEKIRIDTRTGEYLTRVKG
jgi:elongation factor P